MVFKNSGTRTHTHIVYIYIWTHKYAHGNGHTCVCPSLACWFLLDTNMMAEQMFLWFWASLVAQSCKPMLLFVIWHSKKHTNWRWRHVKMSGSLSSTSSLVLPRHKGPMSAWSCTRVPCKLLWSSRGHGRHWKMRLVCLKMVVHPWGLLSIFPNLLFGEKPFSGKCLNNSRI